MTVNVKIPDAVLEVLENDKTTLSPLQAGKDTWNFRQHRPGDGRCGTAWFPVSKTQDMAKDTKDSFSAVAGV